MRAIAVPAAGAQPALSDEPIPTAETGTVLVRVIAAALNPIDNAIAAGMLAQTITHKYPVILGRDAAGTVESVGEGVEHVTVGDAVIGHVLLEPPIHAGTLAEFAALPAAAVAAKPDALDFTSAAALPLAGAAAAATVKAVDAKDGDIVLVVGASGGVGSYVVQLLAGRDVTVVATGTRIDEQRLKALGASIFIDFTAAPVQEQVRAAVPGGVDAVIDLVARTADALPLDVVKPGGRVASPLGAADERTLVAHGLTGTNVMARPTRDVISDLAEEAAAGSLAVDIEQVLHLDQALDGLATLAAGKARGKIIVLIND